MTFKLVLEWDTEEERFVADLRGDEGIVVDRAMLEKLHAADAPMVELEVDDDGELMVLPLPRGKPN